MFRQIGLVAVLAWLALFCLRVSASSSMEEEYEDDAEATEDAHVHVAIEDDDDDDDDDGDDVEDGYDFSVRASTPWEQALQRMQRDTVCPIGGKVLEDFATLAREMEEMWKRIENKTWTRSDAACACRCESCGACISEYIPCGYYRSLGCFAHCFYIDQCMAGRGRLWRHPNDLEPADNHPFYDFRLKVADNSFDAFGLRRYFSIWPFN